MSTPISVPIRVQDLEAVLTRFDRIQVWRSDTQEGTYAEVSNATTRPRLLTGQTTYVFIDKTAEASDWYQTRYARDASEDVSGFSAARQGLTPALTVLSVDELRSIYLFGVKLTDLSGTPVPPEVFAQYIESAVALLETELHITIAPTLFTDERYPYNERYFHAYGFLPLVHRPILSVTEAALKLPNSTGETTAVTYTADMIRISSRVAGHINIIPTGPVVLPSGESLLQVSLGARANYLPNALSLTYTAGFSPVPADLKEAVGKMAAMSFLPLASNFLFPAGVVSQKTATDSLMTETRTAQGSLGGAYGGLIREYRTYLDTVIPKLALKYAGIQVGVLS